MLPFKTRRTSQPQGAVELSIAPLAKGILIALPLGGSRLNSVGSDRRLASAVGAGSGVSAKGVAAKFSGSDYISLGTAPLLDSTTPCAFSIYEESFGTNVYTSLLGLTASGSPNQFLFIRGSDPAYGCALGPANSSTNARNFSGAGVQTAGERIRFFVTCANGLGAYTGIRVWADGVELSSGTTAFGVGAAGTSYVGWDGYDGKFNGLLSDFVLWGRVPSDAEIKAYFDSPGQIYASQSRSLWIPGTVSGGGTTSATVTQSDSADTTSLNATVTTGATIASSEGAGTQAVSAANWMTAQLASSDRADTQAIAATAGGITLAGIAQADGGDATAITMANWTAALIAHGDAPDTQAISAQAGSVTLASVSTAEAADNTAITMANWMTAQSFGVNAADASSVTAVVTTGCSVATADAPDTTTVTGNIVGVTSASVATFDAADAQALTTLVTTGAVIVGTDGADTALASAACWTTAIMAAVNGADTTNIVGSIPGTAVYPLESQVLAGVQYGPTGAEYTGTLTGGSGPSAADIAAAVWSYTQ